MNFKLKEKTVLAVAFLAIISIGSLLSVADQIDQPSHQRVAIGSSDPVYIPAYSGDPSGIAPVSLTAHDWSDLVTNIINSITIVQGSENIVADNSLSFEIADKSLTDNGFFLDQTNACFRILSENSSSGEEQLVVSNNFNGVVSKTTSDGDGFYTGVLSIGTEGSASSNLVSKAYVDAVAGGGGGGVWTDLGGGQIEYAPLTTASPTVTIEVPNSATDKAFLINENSQDTMWVLGSGELASEKLTHSNTGGTYDSDTNISFGNDTLSVIAGGITFARALEGSDDRYQVNHNKTNIDTEIYGDTLQIAEFAASTDNVGFGIFTPDSNAKVHIDAVLKLEPQASAPTGNLGCLYVNSAGTIHFHNGTAWKEISLVP